MNFLPVIRGSCNEKYSNPATPINPKMLDFLADNYEELFKLAGVMDRSFVNRLGREVFLHLQARLQIVRKAA